MKLKVFKIRENAKLPVRAHATDAGMDLFWAPKDDVTAVVINPTDNMILETGLKMEIPKGYMLEIKNKSGIASKRNLVVGACVIDSGYDGEIMIDMHNIGREAKWIREGDKIAQAVLIPIEYPELEVVEDETLLNNESTRGVGGFGSTGDK